VVSVIEKTHFSWGQGWVFGFIKKNSKKTLILVGFFKFSPIFTEDERLSTNYDLLQYFTIG